MDPAPQPDYPAWFPSYKVGPAIESFPKPQSYGDGKPIFNKSNKELLGLAIHHGDRLALTEFIARAFSMTEALGVLAASRPELFSDAELEKASRFPVLLGPNIGSIKSAQQVLEKLRVGEKADIKLTGGGDQDLSKPAGQIFLQLWDYLEEIRCQHSFLRDMEEISGWKLPAYVDCVAALPDFNKVSAQRWFKAGKTVLLHFYPKPEEIPELRALGEESAAVTAQSNFQRKRKALSKKLRLAKERGDSTLEFRYSWRLDAVNEHNPSVSAGQIRKEIFRVLRLKFTQKAVGKISG